MDYLQRSDDFLSSNLTDCHDPDKLLFKKFAIGFKKYLYPAAIEFSITMGTLFLIMWFKIGKTQNKNFVLPPTRKRFQGLGKLGVFQIIKK